MSFNIRGTLRAMPTLFRVGVIEAIAYRAEMFVWLLATTMPFVSLMLWSAVAAGAPIVSSAGKSYGEGAFVTYFLAVYVVRQMISSWAAWEINFEVRGGTLSMRLLKPIHPVVGYAISNLAALPMRVAQTLPVIVALFFIGAPQSLPHELKTWVVLSASIFLGWVISFFANVVIGSLCLYMESSIKVMDIWLASFFIFSGYLYPLDLFPGWLRAVVDWLPFRYQIGVPVEILTGAHSLDQALGLLARQAAWAVVLIFSSVPLWSYGIKRFQAYGG